MLKLYVYYHGVLRYTIVANMEKVQALRDQGFYVVVEPAVSYNPTSGSSPGRGANHSSNLERLWHEPDA